MISPHLTKLALVFNASLIPLYATMYETPNRRERLLRGILPVTTYETPNGILPVTTYETPNRSERLLRGIITVSTQ